jgi:DNA replication protein DnaC
MTENKQKVGNLIACPVCGHKIKVIEYKYVSMLDKYYPVTEECKFCKKQEILNQEFNLRKTLEKANLGSRYVNLDFSNLEDVSQSFITAKQSAMNYCKSISVCKNRGLGMYLFGDNGRGKTALVACMLREAAKQGYSIYLTNLTEVTDKLFKKEIKLSFLKKVDFLVIDDIGSERMFKTGSDETFVADKANEIIASREKDLKPTLFTSNLSISSLFKVGYTKKTIERISSLSTRVFEIQTNESHRLKEIKKLPF